MSHSSVREPARLLQDGVGDGDLPDVVEEGPLPDVVEDLLVPDPQEPGQDLAVLGDGLGVAERLHVPEVEGGHQVLEGRVVDLLELEGPADVPGPLDPRFRQVLPARFVLGGQPAHGQAALNGRIDRHVVPGARDLIDDAFPDERRAGRAIRDTAERTTTAGRGSAATIVRILSTCSSVGLRGLEDDERDPARVAGNRRGLAAGRRTFRRPCPDPPGTKPASGNSRRFSPTRRIRDLFMSASSCVPLYPISPAGFKGIRGA